MPESHDFFAARDDRKRTAVDGIDDGELDRIRAYVYRCELQLKAL